MKPYLICRVKRNEVVCIGRWYWFTSENSGIRCNALSPGGVLNGQNEEFISRISNLIPIRRMANKDEYRGAVQFLCSDASSYINGQNLVMDGGRNCW